MNKQKKYLGSVVVEILQKMLNGDTFEKAYKKATRAEKSQSRNNVRSRILVDDQERAKKNVPMVEANDSRIKQSKKEVKKRQPKA